MRSDPEAWGRFQSEKKGPFKPFFTVIAVHTSHQIFFQLALSLFLTGDVTDPLLCILFGSLVPARIPERFACLVVLAKVEISHTEHKSRLIWSLYTTFLKAL